MHFEQFYLGCLAHASYLLVSGEEAIVVDPQRDVDMYLEAANRHGATIRHIFETHLHADFVSGHKELATRTGAKIYIGPNGGATIPHVEVRDGFELQAEKIKITVLETPGHTPESICLVVTDEEKSAEPWAVLTGDTLFVGDVGRPDLSKAFTPQALAGMLYDSLHNKLLTLPGNVIVYPGHGAGSLCGKNLGTERSSSIRTERLANYALQIKSKAEFVKELTSNLPPRPDYFPQDAQINRAGATALSDLPDLKPITAAKLKSLLAKGAIALDVRPIGDFASGHIPGSIAIPLTGEFASWSGIVLGLSSKPVLIVDSEEHLAEARMRLARIGLDDIQGFLKGGVKAWSEAGFELVETPQANVHSINRRVQGGQSKLLDVRRRTEWEAGHIEGAHWKPLDEFKAALPELNRNDEIAVYCRGGYRSLIACSLLQRAGFKKVINVIGGFVAWEKAGLPLQAECSVAA